MKADIKILYFSQEEKRVALVRNLLRDSITGTQDLVIELPESLPSALASFRPHVMLCIGATTAAAKAALVNCGPAGKSIPLVIITEPAEESAAIELLAEGAEDYLLFGRLERLPSVLKNLANSYRWQEQQQEMSAGAFPQATEGQYRLLFQEGPLPKWIYDRKTLKILDVNEAAIRHYGYSREEFLGMSLLDLRPRDQVPWLLKNMEEAKTDYRDFRVKSATHLKKDGTLISVEILGFNMEFQNIPCTLIVSHDITEREAAFEKVKQAEQTALKASADKEVILESIGDAFYALDSNWRVTYWNKHAASHLGISKEQALGNDLRELFPDAGDFFCKYVEAIRKNEVLAFEEYFERNNSWYEVTVYPSVTGLSIYFRDITARKNADLQLRELNEELQKYTDELVAANKGLEQFSYIISHNLRAPVANILGLADMLKEELPQDLRTHFQDELVNNVVRLDRVILDLNAILEIKGDISQKRERIELQELVLSVTSGIEKLMKKERVELITDFSQRGYFMSLKPYLYSIFQNLIFNSIKYRHPERDPLIEIRTQKKDGKILLSFRDNGIGMDLERKGEQVFGMYKRFHSHVEGKGMGLFMVKTQVELLGGRISVQSEVDKGSVFMLEFPEEETK